MPFAKNMLEHEVLVSTESLTHFRCAMKNCSAILSARSPHKIRITLQRLICILQTETILLHQSEHYFSIRFDPI